jgi:hypothetical protein
LNITCSGSAAKTSVFPYQPGQTFDRIDLLSPQLSPWMIGGLRHLDDATNLDDPVILTKQQLGRLELSDDLLGCVHDAFHGRVSLPA